jgi:hypothetical protein
MLTKERYVLQNFPLFLDPAAVSLEIQVARPGSETRPEWCQLHRVQVRSEMFPFALRSCMVHFFGMEPRAEDCPFLLAYDAVGVLRYRIDKEDDEFTAYALPEELNGRAVLKPSVRVTFDTPDDAQRFLALIESLQAGLALPSNWSHTLQQVLRHGSEARFTTVAQKP